MKNALAEASVDTPRIDVAYIERWLETHGIPQWKIERKIPIWETSEGLIPLAIADIERLISIEDPIVWAWLSLVERESVRDDDGRTIIPAGNPWSLFPFQATMARLTGDVIFECGSEVGKTRDVVLGTLWEADTVAGGSSSLIAADSDITLQEIWSEIEFQLAESPTLAGGVIDERVKPYREKVFANGSRFQMRLCGHDGKQFRGGHFGTTIRADETAKWKNQQQFNELWRAGKPGCRFRVYSTPDGDYSSPFFALCARALPVDGRPKAKKSDGGPTDAQEPKFKKFNIKKPDLPPPFWTQARAEKYREQYGGEHSVGWVTNVLGAWGSPSQSVFPMPTLKPNLRYLPHYRIVVAVIDRQKRQLRISAARLSPKLDTEDGGEREEILLRDSVPLLDGDQLGKAISEFFPPLYDWVDPNIFCGGDLGSAQDPSEFVYVRKVGERWIDVFRLHLAQADWPEQAAVVAHLDHASGHRVKYGLDNGSAGSALVQVLTQMKEFRSCPVCAEPVYFAERLKAFGFGDHVDEIDIHTGEPIPNPDAKDAAGNPKPYRLSNKEFSTRCLERKAQARELEIAWDAGAGDQNLSGPQLMVNHTSMGTTAKGERRYRGENDHHVDARRQAALAIVSELRREFFIPADPDFVGFRGDRRPSMSTFGGLEGGVGAAFGAGSVSSGFSDY